MISFSDNLPSVQRKVQDIATRQLPFAMSRALNDTAASVRQALVNEMQRAFDRPTPFTLNAFMVRKATPSNLVASVVTKDKVGGHPWLVTQSKGGPRRQKRTEMLIANVTDLLVRAVIPADGARLDQYGNWSNAQRNQALSGIGAQSDARSNTTARSAKRNKGRGKYFIPRNGGLSPGIFHRDAGGTLRQIAAFTSVVPQYQPIFRFEEVATETAIRVMPGHLARRLSEAFETAR